MYVTNINRQTKSKIERTFTTCVALLYPYHVVLLYLLMLFEKQLENIIFFTRPKKRTTKQKTRVRRRT